MALWVDDVRFFERGANDHPAGLCSRSSKSRDGCYLQTLRAMSGNKRYVRFMSISLDCDAEVTHRAC